MIIHPALLLLLQLRIKGWLRRTFSGRSVPRLITTLIGGAMMAAWLAFYLVNIAMGFRRDSDEPWSLDGMAAVFGAFIIFPFLFGGSATGIALKPTEIEQFRKLPIPRRRLIDYRIAFTLLGIVIPAVFFGLAGRGADSPVPLTIAGGFLAFFTLGLAGAAAGIIESRLRDRIGSLAYLGRAVIAGLLLMVLAAAVLPRGVALLDRALAAQNSLGARILLTPLRPLARLVQGGSLLDWAAVAVAAGVLLAIVRGMDDAWEQLSDRLAAKAKHGGRKSTDASDSEVAAGKPARARRSATPSLAALDPLLGPARAVLDRHLMGAWTLLRLLPLVIAAILIGPAFLPDGFVEDLGLGSSVGIPVMIGTLVVSAVLQLDFRSDLASIEWFKTLPISPQRAVWGQVLLAPMLAAVIGIIAAISFAIHEGWTPMAAAAALLVGPVSLLLVVLLNAGFLLFPTQKGKRSGFDFYKVGRGAVLGIGFAVVVAITLLPAAAAAWGVSLIPGAGWTLILAAAAAIVLAAAAAAARVLAAIYDRFDVSRDMPESE